MGKIFEAIDDPMREWIQRQTVFFVATSPLGATGHINCSPKGGDALRVIGPHELAYVDGAGSGIETVAHLRENARILIMLCAFDGPPKIMRFHGVGTVLTPKHKDFQTRLAHFPTLPVVR